MRTKKVPYEKWYLGLRKLKSLTRKVWISNPNPKYDSFIESLKESEFTVEKRAELRKTIAALKKSEEIVALV